MPAKTKKPAKAAKPERQVKAEQPKQKTRSKKDLVNIISSGLKSGNVVLGTRECMRLVKTGRAAEIVYANNLPAGLLDDFRSYSGLANAALTPFDGDSLQLGELCGKPFNILVVGISK